jgi:hypothetical protein
MAGAEAFRAAVVPVVLDPEGTHHEFVSGMHGQKLDYDLLQTGTPLYNEWVGVNADFIDNAIAQEFRTRPQVIVGVANGTNRLALDVAREFDGEAVGLVSEKDPENSKRLYLPEMGKLVIAALKPELAVVVEDVGTTGSNSVQIAKGVLEAGAQDVVVVITHQRREELQKLDQAGIKYRAIINDPLPTFSPEDCATAADGFCARGWEFIPRPKG